MMLRAAHKGCCPLPHCSLSGWRFCYLRKLRSMLERLGCLSFRNALASICRIRSRVTENCWPTCSSVWSLLMPMPKRIRTMRSSRGVSEARTRDVMSRRFDWIAASIGRIVFWSSIKSPRRDSPSSPIGGGALPLLQKSKIPEGKGYGGFPVSGIWLRCDVDAISNRHHAKVYGKAAVGSPPMSVPHLDERIIGGKRSLLFGPYAGFSTRFLKHGELTDLFESLTFENIIPLLDVARDNFRLAEYLVGQVLQSSNQQFATLKQFFPRAVKKDWKEAVAGQRVETIKPIESKGRLKHEEGELEFGTDLVVAGDKSLVALLGASPGASTAAFIAVEVLQKCFDKELATGGWLDRLKTIIPTYGIDLKQDAVATRNTRAKTAAVLGLQNI